MIPKLRKAVILTAGLGTRFLPMTKAIPKAMLPILNKPILHYLVEEALSAGCDQIAIVTGRSGEIIENHFEGSYTTIQQEDPRGDGHALLCAKEFIGQEPFAVLFGDEIIDHPKSALLQLKESYEKTGQPVLCVQKVPTEKIPSYGIVGVQDASGSEHAITQLVEKPAAKDAPSNLAIIGKYICTPDLLTHLEQSEASHPDGELRLIDGFRAMLEAQKPLTALEVAGTRFDTGNQLGLLMANLAFARKDPEIKQQLDDFYKSIL